MSLSLVNADYGSDNSDENENGDEQEQSTSSTLPELQSKIVLAPPVVNKEEVGGIVTVAPGTKELMVNPKVEQLFTPTTGPENPFKSRNQKADKNTLTGFVEQSHLNEFQFETERRTFETYGYARDPSADSRVQDEFVGRNADEARKGEVGTVFESKKTGGEKRKRVRNMDPSDIEGYTGPWGRFQDEEAVSIPNPELMKEMEELTKKRKKNAKVTTNETMEEKSILHLKDNLDYQGRTFIHPPQDEGVNLREDYVPDKCFVPKKQVHTYKGHTKGIQVIRWLPISAHLLLSGSMDCKIKIWEVYKQRRCCRTYNGHKMPVKDLQFNNSGTEFLSSSFDRYIKLWDTETGQCKQRFTTGKIPFCLRYHPADENQHFFLSGMQDKKIVQWDLRSGEIVQEYDRHLGPVNSITFFDGNRRFASTSDDKSIRIWEWEIPVDTKLIQDSSLHSIPLMTKSPNQKWVIGNGMDNRVMLFQIIDEKLRFAKKKAFKGHSSAGYAIGVDFAPDMSYICSGDAHGRVFIWDWKNHKMVAKWKAHDNVTISTLWHPHETSKVVSASWDSTIKLWD